nr:porin family protein [uncultured Flavobacterium sp.]
MNRISVLLLLLLFSFPMLAQETEIKVPVDSLYREDQFYANLTYNLVQEKPPGYSQRGFSSGFGAGFLRDMPVNKKRTFAIAAGLGYSFNSFKHNLKITQTDAGNIYEVVSEGSFDKNKLELHMVDLPVEIRWRTSTFESHKFWRVYTGIKLSYIFASKSIFDNSEEQQKIVGVKDLNRLQYGAYITVGYNTWNLYASYGLSSIFNSAKAIDSDPVKLNSLNFGLMFYIL